MKQVPARGRNFAAPETVLCNFKCGSAGRVEHHWQLVVLLVIAMSMVMVMVMVLSGGDLAVASFVLLH